MMFLGPVTFGDLDPDQIAPSRTELGEQTDRLDAAIKQLSKDWFASDDNTVDQSTMGQWDSFVADWKAWNWGPYAIAHIFGKTWLDELVVFQQRFNSFLSVYKAAGVETTLVPFAFTSKPGVIDDALDAIKNAPKAAANTITTVLLVGGAVLVGLYVFTVYEAGRTARATGMRLI